MGVEVLEIWSSADRSGPCNLLRSLKAAWAMKICSVYLEPLQPGCLGRPIYPSNLAGTVTSWIGAQVHLQKCEPEREDKSHNTAERFLHTNITHTHKLQQGSNK